MPDTFAPPLPERAAAFRRRVRSGRCTTPTSGMVPGALQANLTILPAADADAFAEFCRLNPRPCPLLAMGAPGSRALPDLAADLDLATDVPAYRVLRDGEMAECLPTLAPLWRDDFVAFALGCSFSFEQAMEEAGIPVRHARLGKNVAMYVSNLTTTPNPPFHGPMVVSMRPIPADRATDVIDLCHRFPQAHGAPIHIGAPEDLGIRDILRPDFGDPPDVEAGEVCAFWACGVTAQIVLCQARLPLAITHEPGHMLITDLDASRPWAGAAFGVGTPAFADHR